MSGVSDLLQATGATGDSTRHDRLMARREGSVSVPAPFCIDLFTDGRYHFLGELPEHIC